MPVMPSSDLQALERRVQALEERLSFQQHAYDQLHEVMLAQQRELDALRREWQRCTARLTALADAEPDLPHEKPPHY